MTKLNQKLAALFILQILIAAALFFGGKNTDPEAAQALLVSSENAEFDHITISDGEGNEAILEKAAAKWHLPRYHNLPADSAKVDAVIDKLKTQRTGWPVATTAAAQKRFEVNEGKHQRRVRLSKGDTAPVEIYIGTSPGFRKVHVRKSDSDEIYAVTLNTFDFPAQDKEWFDRTLARPKGEIGALEGPDFQIVKKDGNWVFKTGEARVDTATLETLLGNLRNLRLSGAAADDIGTPEEVYALAVTSDGKTLDYHFFEDKGSYYLRHPDYENPFQLAKPDYEALTGQNAESLTKTETTDESAKEETLPES
ncbi:MAG: DUF4340 domain-containing protein [Nitrospiria bacterium]